MLKVHPAKISELQDIYKFLDSNTRHLRSWSVLEEYPSAFHPNNHSNIRIVRENNEIISHAVLKTTLIKTPYCIFNVGMIGSVFTQQNHRHKGISSEVINDCIERAKELKCDFVMLWTDLFDFYKKFGFELAGSELSLILSPKFQPAMEPDCKIIEGRQVDPHALHRVYQKHSVTSTRSVQDVKQFLNIPNSRVYTAWDKNNQMVAYAVEGKGTDLQGYIHEWGGSTNALLQLFQHIQKAQQKEVIVISPLHCKNLIRRCEESGAQSFQGILGMVKVLDPKTMTKKAQQTARRMGIKDFAIEWHNETLYFGTSEEMFKTDSLSDITQLLFGPKKPSEIHSFQPDIAEKLDRLLPLPLWIWGWDSI